MAEYVKNSKHVLGRAVLVAGAATAPVLSILNRVPTAKPVSEIPLKLSSRYADDPDVKIDPAKVPEQFRHLIPLALEWSIGDDVELGQSIAAASVEKKRELADAFRPHFDGLWEWHQACSHLVPQPDELVLFDDAANAANEVSYLLDERGE